MQRTGDQARRGWRGMWQLGAAGLGVAALWAVWSGPAARAYTAEQVAAGQQVYAATCASCHGDRGEGGGADAPDSPGVIGPRALTGFRDVQDLYDYTVDAMPQDTPGSLTAEQYWNVLAWLLAQNNLSNPGAPLGPATASSISLRR